MRRTAAVPAPRHSSSSRGHGPGTCLSGGQGSRTSSTRTRSRWIWTTTPSTTRTPSASTTASSARRSTPRSLATPSSTGRLPATGSDRDRRPPRRNRALPAVRFFDRTIRPSSSGSALDRYLRAEVATPLRVGVREYPGLTDERTSEELIGAGGYLGILDGASYRDRDRWPEAAAFELHAALRANCRR